MSASLSAGLPLKRVTTLPSRSTRNLAPKFLWREGDRGREASVTDPNPSAPPNAAGAGAHQVMLPPQSAQPLFKKLKTSLSPGGLTLVLSIMVNSTPYLATKSLISWLVRSSCPPNSSVGKATMSKPSWAYLACKFTIAV